MQAEVARIAREHGLALVGPNCMGVIDLTANSADVHRRRLAVPAARGGVAGIAQSGSVTDAFVHSGTRVGFSRIISCGSEVVLDVCDYLAYCLDDPQTSSVILFVEGFKRPERFLALADRALELGKPIMAVKVGPERPGAGRGDRPFRIARGRDAGSPTPPSMRPASSAAATSTSCSRPPSWSRACAGPGGGSGRGRTGVVTVSTGEASLIADLVPRTGVDLPPIPPSARAAILEALPTMGYIGNPLDPWGAADPATARTARPSRRWRPRARTTSSSSSTTSRIARSPSEVATANEVTGALLAATATGPGSCPSTCR